MRRSRRRRGQAAPHSRALNFAIPPHPSTQPGRKSPTAKCRASNALMSLPMVAL